MDSYMIVAIVVAFLVMHSGFAPPKYGFFKVVNAQDDFLPLLALGGALAGFMTSGAKWSEGAIPANHVSFFKDANFKGPRRDFPAGTEQRSLSKGMFGLNIKGMSMNAENDTYSSIIVPPGLQASAYADFNYQGLSQVYKAGKYANLGAVNDAISSLKVMKEGAADTYAARFYTDKNFGGKALLVGPGTSLPFLNNIPGLDSRDNAISSSIISPGYMAYIYPEPNFAGTPNKLLPGSKGYIGDFWNDKISSIKILKLA